MSEANVALMRRWFEEVWNQRRKETIFELLAADGVAHGVDEKGRDIHGPKEFLPFFERMCGAFPDMKLKIEDCFGSGDKVVLRWTGVMHHKGDGLGIPASGKPVALGGMTMARVANGKVVEAWDHWDKLSMLQQIGMI